MSSHEHASTTGLDIDIMKLSSSRLGHAEAQHEHSVIIPRVTLEADPIYKK